MVNTMPKSKTQNLFKKIIGEFYSPIIRLSILLLLDTLHLELGI